ncbi:hypothetical protein ROT00_11180 [Agromyces mediolanus]|uniref:hypothetical protein n=1 Tax=Agromyces mediolanus TaxID=41986 RepID=UPI003839AF84
MPTPDPEELRRALRSDAAHAEGAELDLPAVLARSRSERRRRRTALVGGAAAAVVALAVGGLAVAGGLGLPGASTTADAPASSESGDADAGAATDPSTPATGVAPADEPPEEELVLRPIDRLNRCGAPPAGPSAPAGSGLSIEVVAVSSPAPGGTGEATVRITNTGSEGYSGELLAGPALTVADDVTLWHTSGLEAVRTPLALAPGASVELTAPVRAVRCDGADDASLADPGRLPALAPGEYRLSAAVAIAAPDAPLGLPLVSEAVRLTVG